MSQELPVTTEPLVSAEYPKKIHFTEQQYGKRCGSLIKRWCSSINALLATPPPGLKWMSLELWKCMKWLIGWVVYLILGALVFMKLEEEHYQVPVPHPDWKQFKDLLTGKERMGELIDLNIDIKGSLDLKENLIKICNHTFLNQTFPFELSDVKIKENGRNGIDQQWSLFSDLEDVERICKESLFIIEWVTGYEMVPTFINAIHYTMTALTTIGYGHIYPMHIGNRMFCVFYCSIGIPLTFILLNNFSQLLSIKMLHTYKIALTHRPNEKDSLLYLVTAFLITLGFVVFMFLPAVAFMFIENWTYSHSFYYTFITLSTIGFGDLYAGFEDYYFNIVTDHETNRSITNVLIIVYKLIIIIWVMTALGYWLTVIKFLRKALKKTTQKFSKTFSSQVITEQATSFRDLVWKTRNVNEDKTLTNGNNATSSQPNMMDLNNDVEGARSGEDSDGKPTRVRNSKSGFTALSYNVIPAEDEDPGLPLSLIELLGVKVLIRNNDDTVMKHIVTQIAKEDKGLLETDNIPGEVTLPLRDALNLVFLCKQ